jgi:hypothetical protein
MPRRIGALVLCCSAVAILTSSISPARVSADYYDEIDYSGFRYPSSFVDSRRLRDFLKVPPLLKQACHDPHEERTGEDTLVYLVAEASLLRMAERPSGLYALRAALNVPLDTQRSGGPPLQEPPTVGVPHLADPAGSPVPISDHGYRSCLDRLMSTDWRNRRPDTASGWQTVLDAVDSRIPPLSGTPGTTAVPPAFACRGEHEGDWDIVMALAIRLWGLMKDEPATVLDHDAVKKSLSYRIWLEGAASDQDTHVCYSTETENHTWMIRTTRFLHNELLEPINPFDPSLSPSDAVDDYYTDTNADNDDNGLTQMLLSKMREWVDHDFVEYNANPYSRYQMIGLLNLYDFATDDRIRRAALTVIDFLAAKDAAESMTGLRLAPYRRRAESWNDHLFDHEQVNPMMQVWTGALAPRTLVTGFDGPGMTLAASSSYTPPDVLTDVMLNPEHHNYLQQFDGQLQTERSYGARDFTLTGGGVETACPYRNGVVQTALNDTPIILWNLYAPRIEKNPPKISGCPGSGNDPGDVEPIVLIPRQPPDDRPLPNIGDVIRTGPIEPNIAFEPPAADSCIGQAIACGPSFELGASKPHPIPACSRYLTYQGDDVSAWRFDRQCAGPAYANRCFFVYVREIPPKRFEARNRVSTSRAPLAYLVTHLCDPDAGEGDRARFFAQFVNFLTSGPGSPTPPDSVTSCTISVGNACLSSADSPRTSGCRKPPLLTNYYCSISIDLILPTPSGPIEPGQRVSLSGDAGGATYKLSPVNERFAAAASGTLAHLDASHEPLPSGSNVLSLDDPRAGESVHELDTGGLVYDTSDAPRSFSFSASLAEDGTVTGEITSAEYPDLIRQVTVDVEDATSFGAGCTLSNGQQGCYTNRTCYEPPCPTTGPQIHQRLPVYNRQFQVGNNTLAAEHRPISFQGRVPSVAEQSSLNPGGTALTVTGSHDYWIRACVTWHRFVTADANRFGYDPNAHGHCDPVAVVPECRSATCLASTPISDGPLVGSHSSFPGVPYRRP